MIFLDLEPFRFTVGIHFDEVDDEYGKGYYLSIMIPIIALVFYYGE